MDSRCNAGERRVLQQLKRCLEDDYLVWHDVPIGARARQPDFVILSPRQGLLLLEVKDWRAASIVAANRDSVELATARGRATVANPLRQARDIALELVDVMRSDPALTHADGPFAGRLLFPWGYGVVFSHLNAAEVTAIDFHAVFPEHQVLLRDHLADSVDAGALQRRLWGMFTVSYPHTLTLPQRDRIRWHLFPEFRLPRQGALDLTPSGPAPALPPGPAAAPGARPASLPTPSTPPTPPASPASPTPAAAPAAAPTLPAAPAPAPSPAAVPDLLQVLDLQQEHIARTLGEGHRVIHGAAGSGKTMILICRAQQLAAAARPDAPVLVLCFNRALADRIAAQLRSRGVVEHQVVVRTFHAWCSDVVRSYQLAVPRDPRDELYFEALAQTVERALETGFVPSGQYTALLVDEAHDFEDAWLRMAVRLVNPATHSLLVLYDDAQAIYQVRRRRKFSLASVGIEARGRTSILKMNYRNTAEVLAVAVQIAHSLLQPAVQAGTSAGSRSEAAAGAQPSADDVIPVVQPQSAGRRGPLPRLYAASDAAAEARWVAERIHEALGAGHPAGDIAVLARAKYLMRPLEQALAARGVTVQSMNSRAFRHFDWGTSAVRMITLHSAKGLEFPQVFVIGLQAMPMPDEAPDEAARLLYVAMTRATHELFLSASGDSEFVQRVNQALRVAERQLGASAPGAPAVPLP